MATRRSTGKRLRFSVFERDHFTCQYCGAQPPAVVLVPDHIVPFGAGGATTIDNLITACEPCNQGKADRLPGHAAPRPDADLLYLQTQQEIAELRRFQEAKRARDAALAAVVEQLQESWEERTGEAWHPSDRIVRDLITRYSPEVAEAAMDDVAAKIGTGYLRVYPGTYSSDRKWVAYLYKVAASLAREWGEADEG